jgi:hypothetical protein
MPTEPTAADLATIREKVDGIRQKMASDPSFVTQLVQNPRQTLEGAGVPGEAVNAVIKGEAPGGLEAAGCWFSIGCVTTQCCFSISVCCGTGSC